ncbi:restriction endonuclease subunit S [Arcobacter porcinus]|uniref:Type I restriction enzyme specificity protein n=1 Tax=Arcobacter porcinus TaxID=1935204 RepID=A0ABX2YA71_9BACT|nr:restriction endonuclease subunit S [Arcobacter porcinus]OCL90264.1 putative type I restriction enzyme specificity protein [Arcobacter porcinus]
MSNVPKLRFKEFSGEWEENNLKKLSELITKGTTPKKFSNSGITFVKIEGINNLSINKDKCLFIDENTHNKELKRSILKEQDILFAIAGSLGKVAVVTKNILPANTNQALSIIRLKNKDYLNYILFVLQSRRMKKYIYKNLSVGAQPNLSLEQIGNFNFFLPLKQEQEKIASFLISVDTRIKQLTKKEELLQQYKKGVLQKIFNQEIKFKKDDGTEFDEWEEKNLSSLCTIKKGSQLNKDTLTETGDYPAVNGGINPSGHTTQYNTEENTITISEGGNSCGYVNFITTKFWSGGHNYSLQDLKKSIENLYLFQYLKHNENSIMSLRVGSGLPNIQKGAISNFLVLVPCNKEQNKIANFLSSIDTKIEQTQKQLELSKEFKKALLQQIFV